MADAEAIGADAIGHLLRYMSGRLGSGCACGGLGCGVLGRGVDRLWGVGLGLYFNARYSEASLGASVLTLLPALAGTLGALISNRTTEL